MESFGTTYDLSMGQLRHWLFHLSYSPGEIAVPTSSVVTPSCSATLVVAGAAARVHTVRALDVLGTTYAVWRMCGLAIEQPPAGLVALELRKQGIVMFVCIRGQSLANCVPLVEHWRSLSF